MEVMGTTKYGSGSIAFADYLIYRNPETGSWGYMPFEEARKKGLIDESQFDKSGRVGTVEDIVAFLKIQDGR